ncbi:MAG: hypothetical protein K2O04_02350 [Clostridiales bacterium]|nr:hypothetical protein [Clostridiales bacterium]
MIRRLTKSALAAALVTLCLLFAAVLIFAFVPTTRKVYAENEPSVWDGDLEKAGWGDASKAVKPDEYVLDPSDKTLEIGSAAAFAYFAHAVYEDTANHALDGYTVKLTVDIDLDNNTWIPIGSTMRSGTPTRRFVGTFDGNGHTISNFSSAGYYSNIKNSAADGYYVDVKGDNTVKVPFQNSNGEYAFGLFGVTANVTVKNLTLSNVRIGLEDKVVNNTKLIADNVGALIGYNVGKLDVENCTVDGSVTVKTAANPAVGGIVGRAYGTTINGLVGSEDSTKYQDITLKNCVNNADVENKVLFPTTEDKGFGKVSGIIGFTTNLKTCTIENCVNNGAISGGQFAAGISAYFSDNTGNDNVDSNPTAQNWTYRIVNCVNNGAVTASAIDVDSIQNDGSLYKNGKTYAAGITAHMGASQANCKSILSSDANFEKLPLVSFYIENCLNNGDITVYNNKSYNNAYIGSNDQKNADGWNVAGGIVGELYPSETGVNKITNNYNYGEIKSEEVPGAVSDDRYTPRMGGYIGWLYFYTAANPGGSAAERTIDLTLTGGSCGNVSGQGDRVNSLIGDTKTYPDKPCNITLIDANDSSKNVTRGTQATGEPTVSIGAEVEEIAIGEYFGQTGLTEVNFAEDGKLTKIGDWAFAGTGLYQVYLPESVVEIGAAAFDDGVIVIAKSRAHYDALMTSDKVSDDIKELLTYAVTVKYNYFSEELGSVVRLFGKDYKLMLNDEGKWTMFDSVGLGPNGNDAAHWYVGSGNTALTVAAVTELLKSDDLGDKLNLYTYVSDKKVFLVRENIVYDGSSYGMNELNSLLQATGDVILPTMSPTITKYVDVDGNVAGNMPTSICNAGTYTVTLKDDGEEYTLVFNVARATVNLGSYSNLAWRLTEIGSEATNIELLNGNGMMLYIYTAKDGSAYPTTTILTDAQITELDLKSSAYTTKTVLYSAVRNRGQNVTIKVAPNETRYTVGPLYGNNVFSSVGVYTATVRLKATNNYRFTATGLSAQRGMTVDIDPDSDGKIADVSKTWYIVDMGNWLVSANGGDYVISDRVYGANTAVAAPRLRYGDSSAINMQLRHNGSPIGDSFGVTEFGKYINSVMPAGNYELVVTVDGFNSTEIDSEATTDPEDPVMVTVYRSGFTESIVFNVGKAQLPSLENVHKALKGKKFDHTWKEGASYLYDTEAAKAVNAYLATPSLSRENTIWADYSNLYGSFAITFNLASMQNDAYFGANDNSVDITNPGLYTVYYRISAPNYYSSIENLTGNDIRQNYNFEVCVVREIEVPEVSHVTYTGSYVYPTITPAASGDEAFYDILWAEEGYLNGGLCTLTFVLRNSDYYCWKDEELGQSTVQVTFNVAMANNTWLRTPNIVGWLYEEFNTNVNRIRAVPKFLDVGQTVKYTVLNSDGNAIDGLSAFTVNEDGTISDKALIAALNGLSVGSYKLVVTVDATRNYNVLKSDIDFKVGKAMNSWADGDDDLVLPGWIVGKYDATENAIVVNPAHGVANIIITDIDGNEYYNSVTGLNKLNDCEVGKYLLKAWVDETDDFAALAERSFTIEVFEKAGMPWWGTLLITLGALLIAALIIFILWKKGVFQILTGKIVLAIRTKASVDATIAAVRASKKAEESKKSVEAAKRREALEERKAKAAEERALPAEQRAAALEEKAKKAVERADKMRARAEAMQLRAERLKEKAAEAPAAEEPKAETASNETPKAEAAATEAVAVEEPKVETAATETPATEEPAAEAAATEEPAITEESAPKTTKTPAKKKPSNK